MSLLYFRNSDDVSDEPVADTHPLPVAVIEAAGAVRGTASLDNGQTALSTTSAVAVAARPTRRRVVVKNLDSAITVYVGSQENGTVSSSNGMELKPGESIALYTTVAVLGISASGTPSVAWLEEYD